MTEEPFLLNDARIGMDPRLRIFAGEEPLLLHTPRFGVDTVRPVIVDSKLAIQFIRVHENPFLRCACGA